MQTNHLTNPYRSWSLALCTAGALLCAATAAAADREALGGSIDLPERSHRVYQRAVGPGPHDLPAGSQRRAAGGKARGAER